MPADPRPAQPLPAQPSLEQQKKRARELLNAAQGGDPEALERFSAVGAARPSLHMAQLAIAREYGFASWPKLKAHIDSVTAQRNFERYEPVARRAWFFARYEASERGSGVIEPEHLLLALLREGQGSVTGLLQQLQLPVEAIRKVIQSRAITKPKVPEPVEIPFSSGSRRVLHAAADEADRLASEGIACEHLLLGILRHSDSLAAAILYEHGARLDAVRAVAVSLVPMTPLGATSRWVAASRALETERAAPLFKDPFARDLAGEQGFSMLSAFRTGFSPGSAAAPEPYFSIRTKYLDDAMLSAVFESSITQAVILAAGMDTRALRLPWPAGMRVFEIDRDDVFNHKEPVLERMNARPTCDRRVLRLDLAGNWTEPLIAAGFDPARPAAILVEGLLPYLDEATVRRLVSSIGTISCDGSWMGLDTVNDEMLVSPFMTAYFEKLARFGCRWHFGVSDPVTFFREYGWQATKVQPGEPDANYGRWTYGVAPGAYPGVPRTFLVHARKTGR